MLLIIVALVVVASVIWGIRSDWDSTGASFASAFSIVTLAIMLVVLICNNVGLDGVVASKCQQHISLSYQLETGMYNNDNELGKKELYNQIQEWNTDIAYNQATQNDLWIGVFIPDIYDQFELIELPTR